MNRDQLAKNFLGVLLTVCIIFGGHPGTSVTADAILMIATIITSVLVFITNPAGGQIENRLWLIVCLSFAAIALQLLPSLGTVAAGFQGILPDVMVRELLPDRTWNSVSLNPGRTLEVLTWFMSLCLLLAALSRLKPEDLVGLIPFILVGLACHSLVAMFQALSFSPIGGREYQAGFFRNANHFGTLVAACIPIINLLLSAKKQDVFILICVPVGLLLIVLTGSRAALVLAIAGAFLSVVVTGSLYKLPRIFVIVGGAASLFIAYVTVSRLRVQGVTDEAREAMIQTTWIGIKDNLPFGVGFGTFEDAYRAYERAVDINGVYINHAHNDFLELMFEGGLPAAFVLVVTLVIFILQGRRLMGNKLRLAAYISIWIVTCHSLVDYPLRTYSLSTLFVFLAALVFMIKPKHSDLPEQVENPLQRSFPSQSFQR